MNMATKVKTTLTIIFVLFLIIIVYSNWSFLTGKEIISLNFGFKKIISPEINNGVIFLICFVSGVFINFLSNIVLRYKKSKTIKEQEGIIKEFRAKITELELKLQILDSKSGSEENQEP
jgi:hypothetical protein